MKKGVIDKWHLVQRRYMITNLELKEI
jgi:hypothetical protein